MTEIFKTKIAEIPSLAGKVALVTGANSPNGVGFNTALQLAAKGALVYVGARSLEKANGGIAEIRNIDSSIQEGQLKPFVADLGDLKAVKKAAEGLMADAERLDILVNNAGLLGRPLDFDSNGISVGFVANHLGPFVLTTTLLPLLERTAEKHPGVRVVNVASSTHALPPKGVRFDSLASFNVELGGRDGRFESNLTRYGLSKLANVLFAKQLHKHFVTGGTQAISLSLHPGGIKTDGSVRFLGSENTHMQAESLSPADGALTSLFAATSPKIWDERKTYGGAYLVPFGEIEEPSENARNEALAEELWKTSENVAKDIISA